MNLSPLSRCGHEEGTPGISCRVEGVAGGWGTAAVRRNNRVWLRYGPLCTLMQGQPQDLWEHCQGWRRGYYGVRGL